VLPPQVAGKPTVERAKAIAALAPIELYGSPHGAAVDRAQTTWSVDEGGLAVEYVPWGAAYSAVYEETAVQTRVGAHVWTRFVKRE